MPINPVVMVPAPKSKSFGELVVAEPLSAGTEVPEVPTVVSNGLAMSNPLYSTMRTLWTAVLWLKVAVTVFAPALMFLA